MKKLTRLTLTASILSVLLCVSGCGMEGNPATDGRSKITSIDRDTWPYEICIKGVVYYSHGHGKSPAFKSDGSLYTCNT